jgi:hypothetical protein
MVFCLFSLCRVPRFIALPDLGVLFDLRTGWLSFPFP